MPRLRPTQPGNSSVGRNHPSQHKVFNLGIQLPNNSISEELSRPPALLRGRRRSKETDTGLRLHCSSASPSEWLPGQLPIGRRPESRHPVCRSGCWRRRPQWCGSSTGKQTLAQSPAAWPRAHRPLARLRYLLCEVVSDDPRCRLSLEDRVLGGLCDTSMSILG
ncbi:ribonuclease P/MRP protein subunit POP5 isoform X5 [Phocoena sinus]|uniref:ribonuclease P/MRP protein subunit POP5 isoform X5 n=1 Tax=Phocoena sinus TaxID=42100 RepID=UPI0013C3EC05|nr:ribonuclease P/MRP protein subunit POP5 isoform X5 [Phocoena sinus]